MGGWKINPTNLKAGLTKHLGRDLTDIEMQEATLLVDRMARERGTDGLLEPAELFVAAQDLLKAVQTNGYHYLRWQDPQLASATLLTVDGLLRPKISLSQKKDAIRPINKPDQWDDFLHSLKLPEPSTYDRFVAGARQLSETMGVLVKDRFMGGAALMTMPGDSVDIRFNTLVANTLAVAHKLQDRINNKSASSGLNEKTVIKISNQYGLRGLASPPSFENFEAAIGVFIDIKLDNEMESLALIKDNPVRRNALETILQFVRAYGDIRNARDAAEVLTNLTTRLYEHRAANPIGQPTKNFPQVDGSNREAVMSFLKNDLHMDFIKPEDEDGVWFYWNTAWNQDVVKPGDFEMDLDKTSFEYKMGVWGTLYGEEVVSQRYILVSLAAMAIKHRQAHNITSHTVRGRVADLANEQALALLRFVYFLRMPQDPPVRMEEIKGMKSAVTTFEDLTSGEAKVLNDYAIAGYPMEVWSDNVDQQRVVRRSFVTLGLTQLIKDLVRAGTRHLFGKEGIGVKQVLKNFGHALSMKIRGHKDLLIIQREGKETPGLVLVDDTSAEDHMFVGSGGRAAIRVPKKNSKAGSEFTHAQQLITVLVSLFKSFRDGIPEDMARGITRANDPVFDQKVYINHPQWALKAYFGWLTSMIDLHKIKAAVNLQALANLPEATLQGILSAIGLGHDVFPEDIVVPQLPPVGSRVSQDQQDQIDPLIQDAEILADDPNQIVAANTDQPVAGVGTQTDIIDPAVGMANGAGAVAGLPAILKPIGK